MGFNLTQILNKEVPVNLVSSDYGIGDLVKIPFRDGQVSIHLNGSTAKTVSSHIFENEDGTGTGLNVSVPVGLGNGVRIRLPFYGRVFGVRWRRQAGAGDFSVAIDGVPYGLFKGNHQYLENEAAGVIDGETLVVVEDSLDDGLHYAEIVVQNKEVTNAILFFGILVSKSAGYTEIPRIPQIIDPVSLPTTTSSISIGQCRYLSEIVYSNPTSSAVTVTIEYNSKTLWHKSIPANDSVSFIPRKGIGVNSILKHYASATGVNATVIGGY